LDREAGRAWALCPLNGPKLPSQHPEGPPGRTHPKNFRNNGRFGRDPETRTHSIVRLTHPSSLQTLCQEEKYHGAQSKAQRAKRPEARTETPGLTAGRPAFRWAPP